MLCVLGDLWDSIKEWSVFGAGVPILLNETDSVVQYYAPLHFNFIISTFEFNFQSSTMHSNPFGPSPTLGQLSMNPLFSPAPASPTSPALSSVSSVLNTQAFPLVQSTPSLGQSTYGTLPAMPRISVTDKPARVRNSTLVTSRHLSQGRIGLPATLKLMVRRCHFLLMKNYIAYQRHVLLSFQGRIQEH